MNDYNKIEGEPVIREGNWAEEKELRDTTGYARRKGLKGDDDTAARCITHTESDHDWTSQMRGTHSEFVFDPNENGRAPTVQRNSRKVDLLNMSAEEQAVALYEQMTAEKEAKRIAEVEAARFEVKKLNRERAIQTGRTVDSNVLKEAAITLYSDTNTQFTGSTPVKSTYNKFGRDTAFSKPMPEYTDGPTRLE